MPMALIRCVEWRRLSSKGGHIEANWRPIFIRCANTYSSEDCCCRQKAIAMKKLGSVTVLSATKEGEMAQVPLAKAGVGICLLGSLLLVPTTVMAEFDA